MRLFAGNLAPTFGCLLALGLVPACSSTPREGEFEASIPGQAGPAQVRAGTDLTILDQQVFEVVLHDLFSLQISESPFGRCLEQVVIELDSSRQAPTMASLLRFDHSEDWAGFPEASRASLAVAADDLGERAARGWPGLVSPDKRIWVLPGSDGVRPFGVPVVQVLPPGYGFDCTLALVHMRVPQLFGLWDLTYVLTRTQSGWHVVVRQFVGHP